MGRDDTIYWYKVSDDKSWIKIHSGKRFLDGYDKTYSYNIRDNQKSELTINVSQTSHAGRYFCKNFKTDLTITMDVVIFGMY